MKQNKNRLDVLRPAGYDDLEDCGDCVELKEFTVFEEQAETFSGIYDQYGRPLHRHKPRIGFLK